MFILFSKIKSFLPPRKRNRAGWLLLHLSLSTAWIFACTTVQPAQTPLAHQPTQAPATGAILESTQPAPTSSQVLQPEWIYQDIPEKDDRGITFDEMILFDDRLWLATADGVVSIDTKNYESKHYRLEEGLADDVVNTLAVCQLPETMLLAGTRSGFSVYLSDQDRWDYWAEENPMSYEEVLEIDCSPQTNLMMARYLGPNVQLFDANHNIWTTFRVFDTKIRSDRIAFYRRDIFLMDSGNRSQILIPWSYFLDGDGNIDVSKIGDLLFTTDVQFVNSDQNQPEFDLRRMPDFVIFSMDTDKLKLMEDFARMLSTRKENSFRDPLPVYFYDRDLGEFNPAGESVPLTEIDQVIHNMISKNDSIFTDSDLYFGYINLPDWGIHIVVPGEPFAVLFEYHDQSQSDRPGFKSAVSVPGPDGTIWSGGATGDLMFSHFSPEGWTVYSKEEVEGYSGEWYSAQALTITEDGMLYGMTIQGRVFQFDPVTKQYRGLEDFDEGTIPYGDAHIVVDQDGTIYYSTMSGILVLRR